MTLLWTALALTAVVAGFVWIWWDIGWQYRRQARCLELAWDRGWRQAEDQAWANRHAEYEHAMTLTLARAELETVDSLVAALERPTRMLDVVA